MERKVNATEARANFSQIVTEAGYAGHETVIERNNRPVAVVIGYDRYLELCRLAKERTDRFAIYDEIRARNPDAEPEQVAADVDAASRPSGRAVRGGQR